MQTETAKKLEYVKTVLTDVRKYINAASVLNYDQETICPPKAMEEQGEVMTFLENQAFKLKKEPAFLEAAEYLYANREELDEFDRVLAESLHRESGPDGFTLELVLGDYEAEERQARQEAARRKKERKAQEAMLSIRQRYGKNAVVRGTSLQEGATGRDRNRQIGGHRA